MVFVMILTLQANMKEIQAIPIEQLNLEEIEDGSYIGEYYFEDQIGATLEVMVENHQIIDIQVIDHVYGKGQIAEALLLNIIATQSLDVDDVAGATTSSHVLKLSVQDALKEN
jgi:uncharacterized protein with FMN-binding domain